jgi:hypothetical protein
MKVDLLNLNNELEIKKYPEVTSANILTSNSTEPDPEGLASYDLFGRPGTEDRKRIFGYINLNGKFLHPHIHYVIKRLNRNIDELIYGEADFYVRNGQLVKLKKGEEKPSGEKTGTGLEFLYNRWDELNFKPKKEDPQLTGTLKKLLHSVKKDDAFIDKMIVIPPFYRDVDMTNNRPHKLNILYKRLLTNAASLKSANALFTIFGTTSSHKKIQDTIDEIYNFFLDIVGGTKGFIHKYVMGKTTDYSARCVISMPKYDNERSTDSEVSFDRSAVPLATLIKSAAPFIIYGVRQIIRNTLSGSNFIWYKNEKGIIQNLELVDSWEEVLSQDYLTKLINLYYESFEHRLDTFMLKTKEKIKVPICLVIENDEVRILESNDQRTKELMLNNKIKPMNLTELFYMAAYDTCRDKACYVTRYPIEDYNNIAPTMMNIIPCNRTKKMSVNGTDYPHFPIILDGDKHDLTHVFTDTLRFPPILAPALGADFDGDMCSFQVCFTNEANIAAKQYLKSKLNVLNISGSTMRSFLDVSIGAAYCLTYRHPKP